MTTLDLFGSPAEGEREWLGSQAVVLRGQAAPCAVELLDAVEAIVAQSPFRQMVTPGGLTIAVASTNCGALGWTSDRRGYRYDGIDPLCGRPWPAMPGCFMHLAQQAAADAGFLGFEPDACLINQYLPGTKLSLHQDKNERDFNAPIVSVSLGMTAVFLFGGHDRGERAFRISLHHGDVAVWGGVDRLRYHGVMALADAPHAQLGNRRINLTIRKAG
ncbi:DNA oxidative demethylase AlkB [Castellaniella sp.]|uniref:DNA oxidative demethylase AlkB n=1 Tax=Castellaniella sp. TaxID=1955812 RepID=UPI002AFE7053|nr:DNA oxidative demethylase AlkB [Castellaniella sp.]